MRLDRTFSDILLQPLHARTLGVITFHTPLAATLRHTILAHRFLEREFGLSNFCWGILFLTGFIR